MATLGIALVVSLASLAMGQTFQNGIGSFGGLPGIGGFRSGFGSGAFFGNGAALFGAFFNTTITCAGSTTGFSGVATLRRSQVFFGPWWARRQTLGGSFVFLTTTASGTFLLVANERADVERGCSSDRMGPVIQRFSPRFFSNTRPGVIADVTLEQNRNITLDVASINMPFDVLERYAGIGFSLCTGLTNDVFGRQVCVDPIFACCKLGYNNKEAVLLPIP
ncbi:uncharacterized protein [Haliotis asinina]|uniref:uncharacterized protein n=1 Tax=Haliotis asinina TaxID=109174 RepID=UPI00353229CF